MTGSAAILAARLAQILELLAEDDRLNVYAGALEVRPPGAPTTISREMFTISSAPPP